MTAEAVPLEAYAASVYQWTEALLRPYLATRAAGPPVVGQKEFNDPLWGTMLLLPHEVVVLDSPLLQRLRRIRQLGVAHLVYPAAQHTRLEHSLGVTHQMQQLVESANTHPIGDTKPGLIDDDLRCLLRLAGLCHDVGHGLMSHVVENALRTNLDVVRLLTSFKKTVGLDQQPQLSEVAAYYILGAPSFGELLELAFHLGGRHLSADFQDQMQRLVVRQQISDRFPTLHEFLSGPFDADKLDYMPRDARMCGVPVVTDVLRLVQKVRAAEKPAESLPPEIAEVVEDAEVCVVTGIARSGASTLDELALGRSLMFDKIYRHQKVRAAEAMVATILEQVGALISDVPHLIPLLIDDDQLLRLDVTELGRRVGRDLTDEEKASAEVAHDMCVRLRDRRLYVRAFAYAQKMPLDPYRNDDEQRQAMESFVRQTAEEPDRTEFRRQVAATAEDILTRLGQAALFTGLPGGRLEPYLWIDPPVGKPGDNQPLTGRAWLIDEQGQLLLARQANAETQGWADAYVTTRHIGYVFGPAEAAQAVHLATEAVARRMFGVRVASSMLAYAKQDASLKEVRKSLATTGFYTGDIRELRPEPTALANKAVPKKLDAVVERLFGYAPPTDIEDRERKVETSSFSPRRIRDYLLQFPDEHVESGLRLIQAVEFIDRVRINQSLATFLSRESDFEGASICPLGEPKDGSSVMAYFAGDTARGLGAQVLTVGDALARDAPIVFVDDFIGLGASAISILEALLDLEPTTDLHEERGEPLNAAARAELRDRQIAFVFSTGLSEGEAALRDRLTQDDVALRLPPRIYVDRPSAELPTIDSVLHDVDAEELASFKTWLGEVGFDVLADGNERHDEVWRNDRRLGYGNRGLLVVSAYNTPSVTVTALWKSGRHQDVAWRPLFPRRLKL